MAQLIKYWLPVILWMSLIFAGSTGLMSSQRTSRIIGPILRWFDPAISDETIYSIQFVIRKCAHAVEYAVLCLLVWRAKRQPQKKDVRSWNWGEARFAIGVSALYAISDEFHQYFEISRQASAWDVLIDTGGAVMAMLLLWRFGRWRNLW